MEKTVKVSVIMLAYNIENYIEIAIKGVLSQKTDYPVELIIGEDRSTDRTYEMCKRYQEKYPARKEPGLPAQLYGDLQTLPR